MSVLKTVVGISQELDEVLNRFQRGEITKDDLEAKRQELYAELRSWHDSLEDRQFW